MSVQTIETMVEWIENRLTENPTLTELSRYVGYSPCYCSAEFHEKVGMTFKQYLSRRRLDMAAVEILQTSSRFLDIAVQYGFSSQEAFSRAFAALYGCTPCQYRKKNQEVDLSE